MATQIKRIAIVGGGFSGIGCIAACKQNGMEPVCYEQTDKWGGTWCYREESIEGVPSTMASTIINHSKEMAAFSNFPPRKEFNNFMRHDELYQYATEFAHAHDILRHIQYNSEVIKVKRTEDYESTGRWEVTVRNSLADKDFTEVFDGVMVCIGHINRPKMPNFPEQEIFKGRIMHTHSLKNVDEFQDKNVVVVGMGCSGLDAAVTSSNVAKKVFLSTRSGAHVLSRVGPHGYPIDHVLIRRYLLFFQNLLPPKIASWFVESLWMDPQFDHKLYTVKPKESFLCKDLCINEQIASKLLSGLVIQKPDIERFTENGVYFKGDTEETKADVIIMATGYTWKFPFLEEGIVEEDGDKINLYKCIFPTHLEKGTLAIIGFCLPFGPGFPVGELQIRWAARIMSGKGKLPAKNVMLKDVRDRYSSNLKRFKYKDKISIRVDYLQYLDDIASQFGAKPNLIKYFFTDFKLFLKLVFGPVLPYQYRLQGPNRWEGARNAIMTSEYRTHWPLQKRKEKKDSWWMIIVKRILKMFISY